MPRSLRMRAAAISNDFHCSIGVLVPPMRGVTIAAMPCPDMYSRSSWEAISILDHAITACWNAGDRRWSGIAGSSSTEVASSRARGAISASE